MQIDQDFFSNDKLSYGSYHSALRDNVYQYRWETFSNMFNDHYPEIEFKIMGLENGKPKSNFLYHLRKDINTKTSYKLSYALNYRDMESVNVSEFKVLIRRFSNFIYHHKDDSEIFNNLFD